MPELEPGSQKLLGFTDNRQDAALQVGPLQRLPLREPAARRFLGALERPGPAGLAAKEHRRGAAARRSASTATTPASAPSGCSSRASRRQRCRRPGRTRCARSSPTGSGSTSAAAGATPTRTSSSSGWCASTTSARRARGRRPTVRRTRPTSCRHATPEVRSGCLATLFDHLRKWMAIAARCSSRAELEQLTHRAATPTCARPGASARTSSRVARAGSSWSRQPRDEDRRSDEDLIVAAGSRSALARRSSSRAPGARTTAPTIHAPGSRTSTSRHSSRRCSRRPRATAWSLPRKPTVRR